MKSLINTLAIISIAAVTSACSKVGFNEGQADGDVGVQCVGNTCPTPTPTPSPSPTPTICQPNSTATTTTYSWFTTSWSACSVTCGVGTQTRTATCQDNVICGVSPIADCGGQIEPATSQVCVQAACSASGTPETQTVTIPLPKVDVVLILDTSMTNAAQIANLSTGLSSFFSAVEGQNIDWQACAIDGDVTAADAPVGTDGAVLSDAGAPLGWVTAIKSGVYEGTTVLNSQTATNAGVSLSTILSQTAQMINDPNMGISPGQGNVQGIGALYQMVANQNNVGSSSCFRSGATVAAIVITDKDENSTYGNCNRSPDGLSDRGLTADPKENFCEPTAPYEDPATANQFITSTLGSSLVYNSIIVEPGDSTCLNAQTVPEPTFNTATQTFWSPAFYGNEYVSMSNLTNGSVASICQPSNYAAVLSNINTKIVQALQNVVLSCAPMAGTTPTFTGLPAGTTASVKNTIVSFSPALPPGTTITVDYTCP